MPYDNIHKAVDYSLRHDIPFLPELPKLGDSMLDYIKNLGKLSSLKEFKNAVKGYDIVKIQSIGPATLILSNYNEDESLKRTYEHIYNIMDGLDAKEIILFLDEPALGQVGFEYKGLWKALFDNFDVIPGVHVCGTMDWDNLFDSDIKIISFDASKYDITTYPRYRSNKRIAWGIEKKEDIRDFQESDLLTLPCGMSPMLYNVDDCEKNLEKLIRISKTLY